MVTKSSRIGLSACSLAALAALASGVGLAHATPSMSVSAGNSSLPTLLAGQSVIASNDANLAATPQLSYGSLNYYSNNNLTTGKPFIGETFTTGASAVDISSISVYNDHLSGLTSGNSVTLQLFQPNSASIAYTFTASATGTGSAGSWITFTLSGVTLAANTLYAYDLDGPTSGEGALGLIYGNGTNTGSGTSSSELATFGLSASDTTPTFWTSTTASNGKATTDTSYTDNAVFQIVGSPSSPAPEPATLGLFAVGGLGLLMTKRRRA